MIYEDTSIQRGSEGLEKEINTQANELSNSKEDAERQSVTPAAQQDLGENLPYGFSVLSS